MMRCHYCHAEVEPADLSAYSNEDVTFCKKCESDPALDRALSYALYRRIESGGYSSRHMREIYDREYQSERIKERGIRRERERLPTKPFIAYVLEHTKPGMRILEVGCGMGSLTRILLNHGLDVVSFDISEQALGYCRANVPNARLLISDAEYLPFPDGIFDAAVLMDTLEHFVDPKRCLRDLHRVVRIDGRLYANVPNILRNFFHNVFTEGHPLWELKRYLDYYGRGLLVGSMHLHEFSPWRLKQICREAGWEPQLANITGSPTVNPPSPLRRNLRMDLYLDAKRS